MPVEDDLVALWANIRFDNKDQRKLVCHVKSGYTKFEQSYGCPSVW